MDKHISNLKKTEVWNKLEKDTKFDDMLNYLRSENIKNDYSKIKDFLDCLSEKHNIENDLLDSKFVVSILMINKFNHMRKKETKDILRFTDSLVTLFSNDFIGVNKFRGMALSFLDLIPPIKKRFVKKMSYGK